jgi:N-acetylmuramoyl-L-alanine amidase
MTEEKTMTETDDATVEIPVPNRIAPRPHRPPLVPIWVYGAVAAVVAVAVIGVGAALALNRSVTVTVPDVMGLDAAVARTRLRNAGFEYAIGDRRFSVRASGTVLEQDPLPAEVVRKGTTVNVVVSAGTEQFSLPDVIGDGIVLARGTLEGRGLEVKLNAEASNLPKDTVLATNPSSGATVRTGDIVIVTVAATSTVEGAIVPYGLSGRLFVIDPSKTALTGNLDPPLDVTRRLRSLLEASGASVVVTRSLADRDVSVVARAARASEASATAIIGLDVMPNGAGGFRIVAPTGISAARTVATNTLTRALFTALTVGSTRPVSGTIAPDAVVKKTTSPLARITLGSMTAREDAATFKDPAWADEVSRLIYRALGESYGSR